MGPAAHVQMSAAGHLSALPNRIRPNVEPLPGGESLFIAFLGNGNGLTHRGTVSASGSVSLPGCGGHW